jgi:ribosomal protein S18 acetylase RimI-like enzyme
MREQGIEQWDDAYPTAEEFKADIAGGQMYGGMIDGGLASAFTLNQECDIDYSKGNWKYQDEPFRILHRLSVDPAYQNRGIGAETMILMEAMAKKEGAGSIRLDAFSSNSGALRLYEKLGYRRVGEIMFRKGLFFLFEAGLNTPPLGANLRTCNVLRG